MSTSSVAVPLLPPTARPPSVKLLSMKKRPQSIMSLSLSPLRNTKNRFIEREEQRHVHVYEQGGERQQQQGLKRTKVKNNNNNNNIDLPVWVLGDSTDCLLTLPLFHLSPMTHLVIHGRTDVSPNRIASRIVQCIRSMDVTCDYNSEKANATIQTRDQVVLSIQLFKTSESNKIVIDIERKCGDTIKFHSVATTILNAVKSLVREFQDRSSNRSSSNNGGINDFCLGFNNNNNNNDHQSHHEKDHHRHHIQAGTDSTGTPSPLYTSSESESPIVLDESNVLKFEEAMDKICDLLTKDRLDNVVRGMESLSFLTNGKSSNEEITYQAVRAVLQDDFDDDHGATGQSQCQYQWQAGKNVLLGYLCSNNPNDDEESEPITGTQLKTSITTLGKKRKTNYINGIR